MDGDARGTAGALLNDRYDPHGPSVGPDRLRELATAYLARRR